MSTSCCYGLDMFIGPYFPYLIKPGQMFYSKVYLITCQDDFVCTIRSWLLFIKKNQSFKTKQKFIICALIFRI